MSSYTIRAITNPSEEELQSATTAVSEAFNHSFFIGFLDNKKENSVLNVRAHFTAAAVEGEMVVAEVPGQGIVGAAAWFGPGHKFLATEKQRQRGWDELMNRLKSETKYWWDYFLKRYDELAEQRFGEGAKLAGYHLQLIGVTPEYQRKGIGRALMKYAEDKASKLQVATYLETVGATNEKLYRNMGYELAGTGPFKAPSGSEFTMSFLRLHTESPSGET